MPRNPYPGKKINQLIPSDKYFETIVSFDQIVNDTRFQLIEKPIEQGSLNDDKVIKMIEEYKQYPHFLKFKNRIVISNLKDTWYIVDGQHRLELAKQLYMDHMVNDQYHFCWYLCNNEEEMRHLFNSINKDSTKNKFYVQQTDFNQIIISEFMKLLKNSYKRLFAHKQSKTGKIKTMEEFRDELIRIEFFSKQQNSQSLLSYLLEKNKAFYELQRYEINMKHNPNIYYDNEKKYIQQKIIFSLKGTNFIEWLHDSETNPPFHKHKKQKSSISQYKKQKIWEQLYGNSNQGICPISFCQTLLIKGVKNGWQAGHIISEYNGGTTDISNLRPICPGCNRDMGSKNWINYDP